MTPPIRILAEIADALRERRPVVALESSVLAQGLPIPANREAARCMVKAVRSRDGVPAVTAVVHGTPTAGLEHAELERFLGREGIGKVSARDIPVAMARRADGATTVAATLAIARAAGIHVFATGGIGGVHRVAADDAGCAYDESADLVELSRTPMVVVCAGAKSILDLPATHERLETLGITVIGYRTSELPGFFTSETGIPLTARAESAAEIAAVYQASRALGRSSAILVVQPPPREVELPRALVEQTVAAAVDSAARDRVQGSALTPYLLAALERMTGGRSLGVNLALLEANAALAADIAREVARLELRSSSMVL
ncbi:MAG TPA: pseudouridine-5'-phosphate glycosidase [Gemmatimonadaceae bacterium]